MAPCGTTPSRYASSVSPALPTTTLAPERSNHRLIDLPKRKLAVAVTASTAWVPSGLTVAAGEQWELTLVSVPTLAGKGTPFPSILRDTPAPTPLQRPPMWHTAAGVVPATSARPAGVPCPAP